MENSGSGSGQRGGDLVVAPGEFAFVQDTTKGQVNTIVGPHKISMSNTDQLVVWDKAKRKFTKCDAQDKAIQTNPVAPEGFYIALYNPADTHPRDGGSSVLPDGALNVGHRLNIPGPAHFPLWPGQFATVIQGHHLRSNQYLLAQVYNDAEATKNWQKAVLKPQAAPGTPTTDVTTQATSAPQIFAPGQLLIIKGTDVAFFIPPTGIKVVPEDANVFVREAVTLERLEYCILLAENGNKRFVQGPAVVFPEPTEQFVVKDGVRKFKAIELNETTGLYIKVIADYTEGDVHHKAGDELFITGKEQAIYFQREEHSIIRYGDQTKHYAVAVPAGEGRYVLDRTTGVVDLIEGPKMLLCDPRHQVIVRRVLAQKTAQLWYPNNPKVLEVNRELEGEGVATAAAQYEPGRVGTANYMMASPSTDARSRTIAGDTFVRGASFTPPRTITLDTKYEGAVSVNIWTGYAVLIIDKTGSRHVVVGPENVLLEYDETLAPLELSTGTPKTDSNLFRTVYLRVHNNKVSDVVQVETQDLVKVNIAVSYRVNFEGVDQERWFAVENYVRLLCDHLRSLIRNVVKRKGIEEFYGNAIDVVRDAVLGVVPEVPEGMIKLPRPGRLFGENSMRVYDVEVLNVTIEAPTVAALLGAAQLNALKSAIQISEEERILATTRRSEDIKRQTATVKAETAEAVSTESQREIKATLKLELERIISEASAAEKRLAKEAERQVALNGLNDAEIARQKAVDDQKLATKQQEIELEIKRIVGETDEIVKRAGAVDENLAAAMMAFSDQALVGKMSESLAALSTMSGVSMTDILAKLFGGTPFEGVMKQLGTRTRVVQMQTPTTSN